PYSFGGKEIDEKEAINQNGSVAGVMLLPIDYEFECLDGNHRTAAIRDLANEEPGYIADSNMLLNIVHDNRAKKIRKDFVDVNKNAKPTTASINTLFNTRDTLSNIVVDLIESIPYLKETTELLSTSVSKNSKDLYTINNIKNAVVEIGGFNSQSTKTDKISKKLETDENLKNRVEASSRMFFKALSQNVFIKDCLENRENTPSIRSKSVITTGTGIIVITRLAAYILSEFENENEQLSEISRLVNFDWSRDNPLFSGRVVMQDNKIINSRDSISFAVTAVKEQLGYQLTQSEYEVMKSN